MADIDITFSNGSRVFTPTNPPSAPQLGDVNNDGEIDILDAGDVNAFQLTDVNNDGVIDILDAAEVLANGPGGVPTIPPPTLTPPNPFDSPKTCPEGQALTIIPIGNGLTTTGCTSIPTEPPIPGIGPEDNPLFCPPGKVRGFGFDYGNPIEIGGVTVGYPLILMGECTCAEASVNLAELAATIGTLGYVAVRKKIRDGLLKTINDQEVQKLKIYDNIKEAEKRLELVDKNLEDMKLNIEILKAKIDRDGPDLSYPELRSLKIELRESEAQYTSAVIQWREDSLALGDKSLQIDLCNEYITMALQGLENLEKITDPSAMATLLLGGLLPINFIVPKECGAFSTLDDECNCVPISSGSYSYSSLTNYNFKNKDYSIIENL